MKTLIAVFFAYLLLSSTSLPLMAQEESASTTAPIDKRYHEEMKALMQQPVIKFAFQAIMDMEAETQQDLITLTEIPAPPYKEQKRAEKFQQMLKAAGLDSIWTDKAGNVIGIRKGKTGKKTIVLEGHLDTVFPEGTDVTVQRKGDTLMAPGIGDDTRGLALVLAVLKSMQKAKLQTDANVLFIGVVGEEGLGDLRGVKQLFSDGLKIDAYIAVDGGAISGITVGGLGSHRYRITFKGPGGHSFGAFGLANPHNALARAVGYFVADADTFTRRGIRTTYNVGMIGGGTSVNAIPFESWMEVDMRSESPVRLNGIDSLLQAAIRRGLKEENQMKRAGRDLTVEVKLVGDRPSGVEEASIPLVQRAMASSTALGAATPRLTISSTNSNIPISKGIPAVTIGRGGAGGGAHALTEWWVNDKGHLAIQNALLILVSEAGIAK